jgi:hypothetical protein
MINCLIGLDRFRQEQLHGPQVLVGVDDTGQVSVNEAAGQALSPSEPAKLILPPGQWALRADKHAHQCPAGGGQVQDDHPTEPAGQEPADGEEHEEAEVDQHHRVPEDAVDHTPRMHCKHRPIQQTRPAVIHTGDCVSRHYDNATPDPHPAPSGRLATAHVAVELAKRTDRNVSMDGAAAAVRGLGFRERCPFWALRD